MNSVEKDTNAVEVTGQPDVEEPTADRPARAEGAESGAAAEEHASAPDGEATAGGDGPGAEPDRVVEEAPVADPAMPPSLEEEFEALRDRFMRQAAEFQNYRRRTEQEKARMMEYGKASVVQQLLDVVDDFERSLDAARAVGKDTEGEAAAQAFAALSDGVSLVYLKLRDALARAGVEEIDAVGKPFDEHEHEAMMQQPVAEGQEPGIVVGELLKGYRMGDRVLRHARVIVSA